MLGSVAMAGVEGQELVQHVYEVGTCFPCLNRGAVPEHFAPILPALGIHVEHSPVVRWHLSE